MPSPLISCLGSNDEPGGCLEASEKVHRMRFEKSFRKDRIGFNRAIM